MRVLETTDLPARSTNSRRAQPNPKKQPRNTVAANQPGRRNGKISELGKNGASSTVVTKNERAVLMQQWERVTFRVFGLFRKDARTKVGEYVRLAAKIINETKGGSRYSEILDSLRDLGADHPISDAVNAGLRETKLYEEDAEVCRYILWRYEEHLAIECGKGANVDEQLRQDIWRLRALDSLEHIFPQHPESGGAWEGKMTLGKGDVEPIVDNVHRIGNLVLLPIIVNSDARRKGFSEKKKALKKHHLRQIQEITKKQDWTLKQIVQREKKIITWAMKEWADIGDV